MYYFTQEKPFANVDVMQVKFDSRGGARASPSTLYQFTTHTYRLSIRELLTYTPLVSIDCLYTCTQY